jgi:tetratricopeptide (TPR) repeat protein
MLDHFAGNERLDTKYGSTWACWACSLAPDAVDDFVKAVGLAERVVKRADKTEQDSLDLGAVLYRAGRFEEAIERLYELVSTWEKEGRWLNPKEMSPSYACFFLAMAHHQLGRHEQAMKWLDKAIEQAERERADIPYWWWNRRLTLELFEAEARQLLGVSDQ